MFPPKIPRPELWSSALQNFQAPNSGDGYFKNSKCRTLEFGTWNRKLVYPLQYFIFKRRTPEFGT